MSQLPDHDTLFITGLKVDAIIGVFDWEREVQQQLLFDLELTLDLSAAAKSDNVNDALSYVAVAEVVTSVTQSLSAQLVEHLAEAVASALLAKWPIAAVKLRLTKPTAVPAATGVGVAIVRPRQPVLTGSQTGS